MIFNVVLLIHSLLIIVTIILFFHVYVDDVIITRSNSILIHRFVSKLSDEFALKVLGQLCYFLGFKVKYFKGGPFLSQAKYAKDLLECAKMLESTSILTLALENPFLSMVMMILLMLYI